MNRCASCGHRWSSHPHVGCQRRRWYQTRAGAAAAASILMAGFAGFVVLDIIGLLYLIGGILP